MRAVGLWIPRRERAPKVYQPRNRRACLGELIPIDGSDHRWFEDRAPACALLVFDLRAEADEWFFWLDRRFRPSSDE